jgi:hypothetical protein
LKARVNAIFPVDLPTFKPGEYGGRYRIIVSKPKELPDGEKVFAIAAFGGDDADSDMIAKKIQSVQGGTTKITYGLFVPARDGRFFGDRICIEVDEVDGKLGEAHIEGSETPCSLEELGPAAKASLTPEEDFDDWD